MMYLLVSNIIWFLLFFVGGYYHPLPQICDKAKAYDKVVLRHRIICIYHGIVAWSMAMYWHVALFDVSCSK
jgi:hypothetical protein